MTLTLAVGPRDHAQGSARARVTLVEYGDYQCGDCGRVYPIVQALQKQLGASLRFVFRNFPLSRIHEHALHAAEAAEAGAAQNRFWEMHDTLFEHQRALDDANLLRYAKAVGLDEKQFNGEMRRHAHADRIQEDFDSGMTSGVNGTPTFFINGVRHDANADLETLLAAIEETRASLKRGRGAGLRPRPTRRA